MIAYLQGKIKHSDEKSMIVVCGNIGYEVVVPEYIIHEFCSGDDIELYTYQQVSNRDESIELFGFKLQEELALFKQLISISGVGPRSAIGVLSIARIEDIKTTISRGDPEFLQKVAGIGKKTAERIVMELKDKLKFSEGKSPSSVTTSDAEVYEALEGLGYKVGDIREALKQLPSDLETSEEKIKAMLKLLGKH